MSIGGKHLFIVLTDRPQSIERQAYEKPKWSPPECCDVKDLRYGEGSHPMGEQIALLIVEQCITDT